VAAPEVWLTADQGIITDASGGIERWEDQSGNNHHFVQDVEAKRPALKADGFVQNGGDLVLLENGQAGNMTWGGTLGTPFIVDEEIVVTHLAAFDHLRDGFTGSITVEVRGRDDGGTDLSSQDDGEGPILATLTFDAADPGTLDQVWRWKELPAPLTLSPGSYMLTANGYVGSDRYFVSNSSPRGPTGPGVRWAGEGVYSQQNEPGLYPYVVGSATGRYAGSGNMRYDLSASARIASPAVVFDGVDDGLLAVEGLDIGRPSTVLAVYQREDNAPGYIVQNTTGSQWSIRSNGFFVSQAVRNFTEPWEKPQVAGVVNTADGTRAYYGLDDVTSETAQNLTTAVPGRLALGGGEGRAIDVLPVRIAELLVYDRALSPAELRQTQAYLGERYGIFNAPVATPDISPIGDLGTGNVTVTLSSLTSGAEIRYTLDGSEPDAGSALYSAALSVPRGTQVRARAFLAGREASGVAAQYYGDLTADAPPVANAVMWSRADLGVETDADGRVVKWQDLTGSGGDFIQPNSDLRPLASEAFPKGGGVAIKTPANAIGNVNYAGTLGADFEVSEEIIISELGAFDHRRDGISGTITVQIWSRDDRGTPLTPQDDQPGSLLGEVEFNSASPGVLDDQFRFKPLAAPLTLPPGQYTVLAWGYTGSNFYLSATGASWLDEGISFAGGSRYVTTPGVWPTIIDAQPLRYNGAGNFLFQRTAAVASEKAAVSFDGVNDGLYQSLTAGLSRPSTVYIAYEQIESGYAVQNLTGGWWFIRYDGAYSDGWVANLTLPKAQPLVAGMTFDATETRFFLNGEDFTQDPGRTTPAPGSLALGGGDEFVLDPMRGDIAEVIAFDRVLSAAERYEVETYLTERYRSVSVPIPPVVISPPGGFGSGAVSVTLELPIPGAEIRYTTDGSDPDGGSSLYSSAFSVSRGTEVRAAAFVGGVRGDISSAFFGESGGPDELPVAGASMWLRADRGLVRDSEGGVSKWSDLSGNGNHVVQGIASKRPVFTESGLGGAANDAIIVQNISGASTWAGSLGEDFVVSSALDVTHLGAFDHLGDGFANTITVQLWSRDDGGTPETPSDDSPGALLAEQSFTTAEPGELSGTSRFKALAAPLSLSPGAYTIFAWGYFDSDLYREGNFSRANEDDRFRFVGVSRYSNSAGSWPSSLDNRQLDYTGAANFRVASLSGSIAPLASVEFDGVDDGLRGVAGMDFGRPSTVLVAFEYQKDEAGYVLQNEAGSGWDIRKDGFTATSAIRSITFDSGRPYLAGMVNGADFTRASLNGEDVTFNSSPASAVPGRLSLGGGEGRYNDPAPLRISEVVVFDRVLDASELELMQSTLSARNNIAMPRAARPEILPLSSYGTGDVAVTISTASAGAEIRYTTDGSVPDAGSALYATSFNVPRGTRVRAVAFASGQAASELTEAFYGDAASHPLPVTDPAMWLRADTGLEFNDAGGIRRWRDLSGNGHDVIQHLSSKSPKLAVMDFADSEQTALEIPAGQTGVSSWAGWLGTDFIVERELEITQLGVFDSASDGIVGTLEARLHRLNDNGTPDVTTDDSSEEILATLSFDSSNPGTLNGGMRYKPLTAPITLVPGRYFIEGRGFTAPNFYDSADRYDENINNGITYPGVSRYSANNTTSEAIPGTRVGDNRYLATAGFKFREPGVSEPGLDAVRFDGVDDGLLGPEDFLVNRPSTVVMVYQKRNGSGGRLLQSASGGNYLLGLHSSPQGYYAEGWVTQQQIRANVPSVSMALQEVDYSRYFYNGEDLTQNPNLVGNLGRVALGGGEGTYFQPGNADLVELIIYDRVLVPSERQQLSAALSERYRIPNESLLPPIASPAGGLFNDAQTVSLSHPLSGVEIRYTLDGSEPDETSTLYTAPFVVSSDTVVKARGYRAGFDAGEIGDFAFFIDETIPAPPQRHNLLLWLRAGIGTEGASSISRWRDLSGKGADAEQANVDSQPVLSPTFVGGAPSVVFDGTNDFLRLPEGFSDVSEGLTAMFVVRSTGVRRWERILDLGRGTNNSRIFFGRSNTSNDFLYSVGLNAPSSIFPLNNTIFTVTHGTDGVAKIFVNGSLEAEVSGLALPAAILKTTNFIGESNYPSDEAFSGGISEIVFYNTALGDLERETFEQSIAGRYGIASTSAGTVAFSPDPSQLYPSGVDVTLQSVTAGAEIRYTLDGTTPDETSALYSGPISLANSARVRARAFAEGFNASQFSEATYLIGQPPSSGDGLLATYYDNDDFTGASLTRVDPNINFEFSSGSPDPAIAADTFSARWTGKMTPRFSEDYVFSAFIDDGFSLWIDLDNNGSFDDEGELILDFFSTNGRREVVSAPVALQAGQLYNIKADYREATGFATVALSWSSFSEPKSVIPQSQLFANAPFNQTVSTPVISPTSGTYNAAVQVSISTGTPTATIYYTTDHSIPTTSSTPYAGPFTVAATSTVRARAFKAGFNPSGTAATSYTIDAQPPLITEFAWNGVAIADGETFVRKGVLSTTATDNQGVTKAEFYYQLSGSTSRVLIGADTFPANGLAAEWNIAGVSDGAYQIIARVFDTSGIFSESVKDVNVQLAVPTAPQIVSPASGISIQDPTVAVSIQAEANANIRVLRDGIFVFSGYTSSAGVLNFTASLPTGTSNLKATARNRAGTSADSNTVSVTRVREFPQIGLSFDANTVVEGSSVTGTLTIPSSIATDLMIQVSNSRPDRIEAVPPVLIPAGSTSATFQLRARIDSIIQLLPMITVTAQAPEYRSATASLFLADSPYPMIDLVMDETSVQENAGQVTGRVTLENARSLALRVYLTNSLPGKVSLPPFVTIPGGQTSVMFTSGIADNDVSDGNVIAQIGAEVRVETTAVSSAGPVALEVRDDDGPSLTFTAPKPLLNQGTSMNLILRRSGGDPAQALGVTLTQDPSATVNLPASANFPAGVTQISIPVSASASSGGNGTNAVTLRAAAAGFTDALVGISVSDESKPDLVPRSLSAPVTVLTESQVSVDYRVENYGPVPTGAAFFERVFLSKDTGLSGDDILVRQVEQSGSITGEAGYGRSVSIFAPREVGDYYLIVTVDPANDIAEISETNNTTVLLTPLQVRAAYSATVSTETTVIPTNTPILLTGSATRTNGQPATAVLVNIHIEMGGTQRVISAVTNSAGQFNATFRPLPNEGGIYTIGAAHPGVTSAPEQDTFEILTMGFDPPSVVRLDEGETVIANAVIRNPNARDLTGLSVVVGDLPSGLSVSPNFSETIVPAFDEVVVPLTVSAAAGFSGNGRFQLTATVAEGVTMDAALDIRAALLKPVLTLEPSSLNSSALRGENSTVSFKITNTGGLATGVIQVLLPDIPWINLVSANPISSLEPGQSADVSLRLSPDSDVPLTLYTGNLALNAANGGSKSVPYRFRVVTDLEGDLTVDVVDELFYFTDEAPKLAGARVIVRDAITSERIAEATTTETGTVSFPGLMEGWYKISVTAERHDNYNNNFYVNAGTDNFLRVFISKQLVNYSWTVEEVEIEDTYRITVETTFETNVPAPVVTISPGRIDVADLTELGQTKVVNLTITNQGLIAADEGVFDFSEHPFYTFTPLVKNVGTIPAKSSLVVPVTIQRVGIFDENGDIVLLQSGGGRSVRNGGPMQTVRMPRAGSSVPCGAGGSLRYSYPCGPQVVSKSAAAAVSGVVGNCGGGPSGGGGYIGFHGGYFNRGGGSPGGAGASGGSGISFPSLDICDPCVAKALLECVIGFIPGVGCGYGTGKCVGSSANAVFKGGSQSGAVKDCVNAVLGCLGDAGKVVPVVGQLIAIVQCIDGLSGCGGPGPGGPGGAGGGGSPPIAAGGRDDITNPLFFPLGEPWLIILGLDARQYASETSGAISRAETLLDYYGVIYGTQSRVVATSSPEGLLWAERFSAFTKADSAESYRVSADEMADLGAFASALDSAQQAELEAIVARWNRTLAYADQEIFEVADVPEGQSVDFIPDSRLKDASNRMVAAYDGSRERGFADPMEEANDSLNEFKKAVAEGGGGVCSRVKIEISQDLVLTRTAFEATLTLENERDDEAVTEIGFDLQIRDPSGEPSEDLFNIQVSRLSNLAAIDGTGELPVSTSGSVQWTLIPRDTAALTEEKQYTVGGVIHFVQDGQTFNIPVENMPITVRPDASLSLKYFHQRDVYSDDPFTDIVEPAIPYKLAVLVENSGFGSARDLKIISGQPKIVENEKGLFVDFKIIGTEVDGQNLSPSLTAEFGELPPGASKIATFLMTSTLQGLFIDYNATFEHVTGLGDSRISLLQNVEIHEMIRVVRDQRAGADTAPDFLVNDVPDVNDYPDTVHYSDGGTDVVTVRESGSFTGTLSPTNLSIQLDVGAFSGWSYIRLPDPAGGDYRLTGVTRADGRVLPLDFNAWQTDRTFIGQGRRPIYEHILHLADTDSAGVYTLTYSLVGPLDSVPPTSSVTAFAGDSPAEIPVFWSGSDNEAVAFYDIYVSSNGGPFTLWKDKIRETGAIYPGTPGETYSFYSVAYDNAGNKETKSATAEATTLAANNNQPPVFTPIPNQTIEEGKFFSLVARATDPDGNSGDIRYSVGSAQTGVVIDPVTGTISWNTGEGDGGKTISVVAVATDGGVPPAVANQAFTITVEDVNDAPIIQPIASQTINAGGVLIVDADATDRDFPLQTMTYSLEGAPAGAGINPTTGVITWSPTNEQADAVYSLNVRVTDSGTPSQSASLSFSVTVPPLQELDQPPVFTSVPVVLWVKGTSYSLTVQASDPEGDPISLAATLASTPGASFADQGNGSGSLSWNPSGSNSGIYLVPVTATANGKTASSTIRIRVEDDDLYWSWVADAFGDLPDGYDLELLGLDADPDMDGRENVHEMALMTNPLQKDQVPLRFSTERNDPFAIVRMSLHRRTGSEAFVDLRLQRNADLAGAWQAIPQTDYSAAVDAEGDDDGRAETQSIDFDIFEYHPAGLPDDYFYRIESIKRPQ